MGWNYWYTWTIILPAELSAASVIIDFWDKNTKHNYGWVTICMVVVIAINLCGAGTLLNNFLPIKSWLWFRRRLRRGWVYLRKYQSPDDHWINYSWPCPRSRRRPQSRSYWFPVLEECQHTLYSIIYFLGSLFLYPYSLDLLFSTIIFLGALVDFWDGKLLNLYSWMQSFMIS